MIQRISFVDTSGSKVSVCGDLAGKISAVDADKPVRDLTQLPQLRE